MHLPISDGAGRGGWHTEAIRQSTAQHHVLVCCHYRYHGARLQALQAEKCHMSPAYTHRPRVDQLLLVGDAISGVIRGQCKEGGPVAPALLRRRGWDEQWHAPSHAPPLVSGRQGTPVHPQG